MYIIKTKEAEYEIPKENLVPFAQFQAIDRKAITIIASEGAAIEYLKLLGMEVKNV